MTHRPAAERLMEHLGLAREAPTLDFLHRLVRAHQRRVPFETLTKLIDWEPGLRRGDFLPPFDAYVERIVARGAGGLCWTLASGFRALLLDLGFEASLMLMAPGHCCVRVELREGPHYADVGYAAPLFQAYPLFESFSVSSPRETFDYRVSAEGIEVVRTPGPTKRLDPAPRSLESLRDLVVAANDWSQPQSFLRRLSYSAYVDGVYTSLRDGILRRFTAAGEETSPVAPEDAPDVLAGIFGADPSLWREAAEVHRRWNPPSFPAV
jgi:hypothetical protein